MGKKREIVFLGVPIHLGANRAGIDFALDVLRENYPETFRGMIEISVEKQKEDFKNKKMKYKNTILHTCEKLAAKVNAEAKEGKFPIIIGGDHSIALGSISGMAVERKNLGVIWIDAHGDMNTDAITESGNIHGMPLALLQGHGDPDLVKCFHSEPKIKSENVVVLGARDLDFKERELMDKLGVKHISYQNVLDRGLPAILKEIKDHLKVENIHISFDVDSIDPNFAPGVSTPVHIGFTPEEMFETFDFIFRNYNVSSVDIVEFNPVNDEDEKTCKFVNELTNHILKNCQ